MTPDETHYPLVATASSSFHPDLCGVILRPMVDTDTESVVRLICRAMNPDESGQARKTFEFHFACKRHAIDDGRIYYVLVDGVHIGGVAGLHHYLWGPPANVWLAWFAIDPDQHRRGLGKKLLDFIVCRAQQLGYMKLFIETYTTPEFAKARAFYLAMGFFQVGCIESYLFRGGDMVVFCKDLTTHA